MIEEKITTNPHPNVTVKTFAGKPKQPVDKQAKLIIVSNVHYRGVEGTVKTQTTRGARLIKSNDDPIERKITIGEQWYKLETAWIKTIGYLSFRNNGGKTFQEIPTPEQIEEAQAKIVELGFPLLTPEEKCKEQSILQKRTMYDGKILSKEEKAQLEPQSNEPDIIPLWQIRPGECFNAEPANGIDIYLRCQRGETSLSVFILPS